MSVEQTVDSVRSVSASACHIGGPNSVNPGQILLVYGKFAAAKVSTGAMFFISTHSILPCTIILMCKVPWSNAFWPGLTPFGPPMWQAEADTELTLSASPTTAVGQKALALAKRRYSTVLAGL